MYENLFPQGGVAQVPFLYDKKHNELLNSIIQKKGLLMNDNLVSNKEAMDAAAAAIAAEADKLKAKENKAKQTEKPAN